MESGAVESEERLCCSERWVGTVMQGTLLRFASVSKNEFAIAEIARLSGMANSDKRLYAFSFCTMK